jgi:hypothetical protein
MSFHRRELGILGRQKSVHKISLGYDVMYLSENHGYGGDYQRRLDSCYERRKAEGFICAKIGPKKGVANSSTATVAGRPSAREDERPRIPTVFTLKFPKFSPGPDKVVQCKIPV